MEKNINIELWRFIFTILICLLHFGTKINNTVYFRGGYIAVEFFFILSGYLLMVKVNNNYSDNQLDFTLQKIKRLYPHIFFRL